MLLLAAGLAGYVVRRLNPSTTAPPSQPGGPPVAAPRVEPARERPAAAPGPRRWFEKPVAAMIVKSPRERLTELIGSLLLSALAAAAVCCFVILMQTYHGRGPEAIRPEQCAWLLVVSIAGSWAVLAPSKFWEGFGGDAWTRRLVLMMLGLTVGAIAYLAADALMVRLTPDAWVAARALAVPLRYRSPPAFYAPDGRPLLPAFLASFGTLFLFIRFWRLADPMRRHRLRLWPILLHVGAGFVVSAFWEFPQPWLPMVAGAISASVQLSSPWVPRQRR
jgi:hypothetical protein